MANHPFQGAAIKNRDFHNLDFHKRLYRRRFTGCHFAGNLNAAAFNECTFDRCVFKNVSLNAASFTSCTFDLTDFTQVDLQETQFFSATANGCTFDRSRISAKTLTGFTVRNASINQVAGLPSTWDQLKTSYKQVELPVPGWEVFRAYGIWTPKPPGWRFEQNGLLLENANMDRFSPTGSGVHFTTRELLGKEKTIWRCVVPYWADVCMPYYSSSGRASGLFLLEEIHNPAFVPEKEPF